MKVRSAEPRRQHHSGGRCQFDVSGNIETVARAPVRCRTTCPSSRSRSAIASATVPVSVSRPTGSSAEFCYGGFDMMPARLVRHFPDRHFSVNRLRHGPTDVRICGIVRKVGPFIRIACMIEEFCAAGAIDCVTPARAAE